MAGKAILTCRPNSHPFQERTLSLEQPVKIGRSVARARPASNNAIFDCKVLSRNHAVIWYANGKFFLQDTKSSNGTFVNNQRLSKSGEESLPREVSSGDIVQFGVDVLENTKKVTHGCIVANLILYLPDGKEAKASDSATVPVFSNLIPVEDLYELHHYLQDAIQREHLLETKLLALQEILCNIREAADHGWKALIAEDSLLTRVEALENQLQIYAKNFGEDKLKEDLKKLQEDKTHYQNTAKGFLKKILEEKLEAVQNCQEVKRSLVNLEAQCSSLSEELSKSHLHIQELAQKLGTQISRNEDSEAKLQELEDQHMLTVNKLESRNQELEEMITRQQVTEACLERQLNELRAAGKIGTEKAVPFDFNGKTGNLIIEENTNKENMLTDINSDELEQLKNSIEKQRKCKEVLELIIAQRDLLLAEKHARLQQINNLQDDYDEFSLKHQDVEEECVEVEARLESLEAQIDGKSDLDKIGNGCEDSLEEKIRELKAIHEEVKTSKDTCEDNMNLLKDDIDQAKDSLSKTSGSCLVTQEKLEKAQKDYEESQLITQSLTEQVKLGNQYLIENTQDQDFQSSNFKKSQENDENDALEKQMLENQHSKQKSWNDQTQLTERVKTITAGLESRLPCESNKILEELHLMQQDYLTSQKKMLLMESEITSLKENCLRLQEEKEAIENEYHTAQLNYSSSYCSSTSSDREELLEKLASLEERLVTLASEYMKCNEERVVLSQKLASKSLDYDASTNQSFFNLFFALPCILLFFALAFVSYPTLSHFMGTADYPEDQPNP